MLTAQPLTRPVWLAEQSYPFTLSAVGDDHERVAFTDAGQGPTVLFVHCGMWSYIWRDVVALLATDHRCLVLDAPGTGLSAGSRPTLRQASEAVTRLVSALDLEDLVVVFHDLGGPVTLHAATGWHQRIRGLIAVNTFGWRPEGAIFRGMLTIMGSGPVRELDVATGFLPRLTATRFGAGRHWTRRDRQVFRRGVDRRGRRSFHHYLRDARRSDIFDGLEEAAAILSDRPILTIFGERNDPLHFQPRWWDLFPHNQSIVVPKGNHFPMCDAPSLVADAIRTFTRPNLHSEDITAALERLR
jgi:pimeloyl-ACP methyl ester carboxylesterase